VSISVVGLSHRGGSEMAMDPCPPVGRWVAGWLGGWTGEAAPQSGMKRMRV